MDLLREILQWSLPRPEWQRDALRRLITAGELKKSDLEELAAQCKAAYGLAEKRESAPLEECHVPSRGSGFGVVKLTALTHHGGVNALAGGQKLEFGPALTIVYGANASGKSGYTRILKRACRARGGEGILGNVLAESSPGRPSATIRFQVGDQGYEHTWTDQGETHEALGRVSVFDSQCAAVYLREETDVAFRPFGLDLFDKLSDACEEVRKALEAERKELASREAKLPDLPEGTTAHQLVSNLTSLTNPEEVKKCGLLSEAERDSAIQLRKRLQDLQAEDPKKTAKILTLRAQRVEALAVRLVELDKVLSDSNVKLLFEAKDAVEAARRTTEGLKAATFPSSLLRGTGSNIWRELWEAARRFSTENAYPDGAFPVIDNGARCVLCQQNLTPDAAERLKRFEEFLQSAGQQELDKAIASYEEKRKSFENLVVADETSREALDELRIETEHLSRAAEACLSGAQLRRDKVLEALQAGQPVPAALPTYESQTDTLSREAQALRNRAGHILRNSDQDTKNNLSNELRELDAREALGKQINLVLDEIERKKKLAAYQLCLQDTNTQGITRKSTEVTKLAVTQQLATTFEAECKRLRFTHLEVELHPTGGARGVLYHKLVLKRAQNIDLPRVVSEGEARALSIAGFFAELSTASDRSAIIFDDPVSSLDHEWRENVARRLAEEAEARQVIVFTHDIVFLLALTRFAEDAGVSCDHQYLRREVIGTGVTSPELPWVAMKVRERIGVLKNMWQRAEKLHRIATRDEYEREAVLIYGLLREAWERGLEEILLGGVVERYRQNIQTQQVKQLSDITEEDCRILEAGITKCSRWLPGHDQAPAENVPTPDPSELKSDVDALESWVKTISKRRK